MDTKVYEFVAWDTAGMGLKDIVVNNFYYGVSQLIAAQGASLTLLILGVFLAVMTLFKTLAYFASSAVMIPLRTGVVRDIRRQVYNKVLRLPLAFFSEERKGDIIARMSGDVTEVETSVTSSLDMLIKNPILIIVYFATLIAVSWQLTVFTLLVVPVMGWIMGTVGKKLKRQSLDAQSKWSDTMSSWKRRWAVCASSRPSLPRRRWRPASTSAATNIATPLTAWLRARPWPIR